MKFHLPYLFISFSFALIFSSCTDSNQTNNNNTLKNEPQKVEIFAIKNINIIPMTLENEIIENANVVISKNKILSINNSIPDNAKVIDGRGRWLIPGLIDMHVHVPTDTHLGAQEPTQAATLFFNTQDLMTPYVANGVTTIFELSAKPEHFGQRNDIARGDAIGPRIALAALIDGGNGSGRIANTAQAGRQTVRNAKAEGYKFIKLYSGLNVQTFQAIIDEANKQGLRTIGHIPDAFQDRLKDAFIPHFGMIAHAEEFSKRTKTFTDKEAQRFAQLAKENGTWFSPTLTTMEWIASQARSLDKLSSLSSLQYVHPLLQSKWLTANNYNEGTNPERVAYFEKIVDFHVQLIQAFKEAGVPIVAGTDTGTSGIIPGFAVHDEIQLLVEAGLTPKEALISATRLPATWLEIDDKVGTVETGKYADLVLLNANPLTDIKNTREIYGVFVNGEWLKRTKIDQMLSELSRRNADNKEKFDWNKVTNQ